MVPEPTFANRLTYSSCRFALALSPAIACLLTLAGCAEPAVTNSKQPKVVAVKAVIVETKDLPQTTRQPATVLAFNEAKIRAQATGYITKLAADIGDYVQKGDTLAVISVPELEKQSEVMQARVRQSEAKETQANAGVELAKANVESAKAGLEQARSELTGAEATLAASEAEFSRTNDLVNRQSLQRRMLDEVRKKRDSEKANQSSAESMITAAEANILVAEAELAAAEADLVAVKSETVVAKKQLEELQVLVDYATLKAPFTGVVTKRSIDLGDLVQQDAQHGALFVVSEIDKVRVQMPVPEAAAAMVNPGDEVKLTFPSFTGESAITAKVTRVSGSLDPSTRTMLVESEIKNDDKKLIPGMFGQATITLDSKLAANMLPARAVRFSETGQAYVYALKSGSDAGDESKGDATVSIINVTTGMDDGSSIEILNGVGKGEKVIDAHLKRFTTGQKVALLD